MRQHISVEQLNELSDKGKEKLREWYKKYKHEIIPGSSTTDIGQGTYFDPLLSIGQMIEFLEDQQLTVENMEQYKNIYWTVYLSNKYADDSVTWKNEKGEEVFTKIFTSAELVDALWEAVKQVLEQDETTHNSKGI